MGTNFYLYESAACVTCGHEKEPLHIGKSSAGWCFSLHYSPEEGLRTLEDWQDRWRRAGAVIKNEYGEVLTPDAMERIITVRFTSRDPEQPPFGYKSWDELLARNHATWGPHGLMRFKLEPRICVGHGEGTWDYIPGRFS